MTRLADCEHGRADKFMDRISTQVKQWIATSAVTETGLWLAHFKRVAIEQCV
jgi:hypothetical protein